MILKSSTLNQTMNVPSDIIAIDTETGGLLPSQNALLSIAAVASWDTQKPFLVYLWPHEKKHIVPEAAKVNGYNEKRWQDNNAQSLETGFGWFCDWLRARLSEKPEARLVCHNLTFDKGFLEEAASLTEMELPGRYRWRCSMNSFAEMMDDGLVEKGSASLQRLAELSGAWALNKHREIHDPMEDAMACLFGYLWLRGIRKRADVGAANPILKANAA